MIEENKALVLSNFEEVINKKNLLASDDYLASDFIDHSPPRNATWPQSSQKGLSFLLAGFPDLQITIEDIVAEGDRVAVRNRWQGTHQSVFMGIPPTGRHMNVEGMVIWRIANGKLAERWGVIDLLSLMQQLGVVPAPGQASS